jgi:hypothetical protein
VKKINALKGFTRNVNYEWSELRGANWAHYLNGGMSSIAIERPDNRLHLSIIINANQRQRVGRHAMSEADGRGLQQSCSQRDDPSRVRSVPVVDDSDLPSSGD